MRILHQFVSATRSACCRVARRHCPTTASASSSSFVVLGRVFCLDITPHTLLPTLHKCTEAHIGTTHLFHSPPPARWSCASSWRGRSGTTGLKHAVLLPPSTATQTLALAGPSALPQAQLFVLLRINTVNDSKPRVRLQRWATGHDCFAKMTTDGTRPSETASQHGVRMLLRY